MGTALPEIMQNSSAQEQNLVGRHIFGQYTFVKKLGEGGMGAVYLAAQDEIDQKVAVKVLHARAAKNDELLKRFVREAKAVSMMSHPNIIRVFIFGRTDDNIIYLAMEYVEGKSLRDMLLEGPMNELRAIKIAKQALSAMAEAHDLGIIHRDLKPDNILLMEFRGEKDFVKVLDFGIAKIKQADDSPEQKLTQAGVVYGTPEYLSPEQAQAAELDHRTDIYSMGVILYEMLTGQVPFSAPSAVTILTMHVFEEPEPPSRVSKGVVSPEMEAIILKAMAKNPEERYDSAMDFFAALSAREWQLVQSGGMPSPPRVPGLELYDAPPPASGEAPAQSRPSPTTVAVDTGNTSAVESERSGGGALRKLLIVAIVLAVLVLLALAGVIAVLLVLKS